jgi:hypothetical protein
MSQAAIETFLHQPEDLSRLNDWIFETILPFIKGRVLETHSGEGRLSARLLEKQFMVHLNASSDANREQLRQKFLSNPFVGGIHKLNFLASQIDAKHADFQEYFATVIAFNDIEENTFYDTSVIRTAVQFLRPRGHFITLGQCTVSFFPNSIQDFDQLKSYNRHVILSRLGGCAPLRIRFFDWQGLCFLAIGKKPEA